MKTVIIGAGSISFGRGQIADLLQAKELQGQSNQLVLVDTDEQALERMTSLAMKMKEYTGSDMEITNTTDRTEALPGANYVITAVARKRYQLWEQDFRIPLSYGFRHCTGENGGPGALFHALRSFELILPICRDVERLCPDAWFLNFTNPEARVLHAILHLTKVKAAGICHGYFSVLPYIEKYLNQPASSFKILSAGINHLYILLKAEETATGTDRLPELIKMAAEDDEAPPLFRKMAEVFGVFTFPSDDHIGEYLAYGAEYSGVKWHYGIESRPQSAKGESEPSFADLLNSYANGDIPVDELIMSPSGEITVPIITDIEFDTGNFRPAVNVLNTEGYVSNLPTTATIEVPATVDAKGIHPLQVGPIPEPFAALLRTQCAIIALVTEAYRTRSKKLLLQALLLDPNVNSITSAEKMLDEMLRLQSEFLPSFE